MDRREFLSVLRQNLEGYIPIEEVEENLLFYQNYFEESGQSEQEVIEALGDPRLIARTIVDAYKASKGPMADFYTQQARYEFRRNHTERYDDEVDGRGEKTGFFRFSAWYRKLAFWVVVAAILLILSVLIGFLVVYILPVILLIIGIKLLFDYFNR